MAVEMMRGKKTMGQSRSGVTLVEVLVAIIIISLAMGAVLNVFSYSLRLTVETAQRSGDLIHSYMVVERNFFLKDLSGVSGAALVGKPIDIVLSGGGGTPPTTLRLNPYDVGGAWPLRVYRTI